MTNEERNTALYQKMFAEQETFRDWLKDQPPEEILNHAYEYTIREDILLSLEYHNLSDAQINALMESPSPLADVFRDFEKLETDHMDTVWDCMENRADAILEEQRRMLREMPVCTQTSVYKGYKQDKIEMRGDRAEMSDFPLYLNTVAGGLDCRDQTIGGFSFVVKIYAVPVVEIIG